MVRNHAYHSGVYPLNGMASTWYATVRISELQTELDKLDAMSLAEVAAVVKEEYDVARRRNKVENTAFRKYRQTMRAYIAILKLAAFPEEAAELKERLIQACRRDIKKWYKKRPQPKRLKAKEYRRERRRELRTEIAEWARDLSRALEDEKLERQGKQTLELVLQAITAAAAAQPSAKKKART